MCKRKCSGGNLYLKCNLALFEESELVQIRNMTFITIKLFLIDSLFDCFGFSNQKRVIEREKAFPKNNNKKKRPPVARI